MRLGGNPSRRWRGPASFSSSSLAVAIGRGQAKPGQRWRRWGALISWRDGLGAGRGWGAALDGGRSSAVARQLIVRRRRDNGVTGGVQGCALGSWMRWRLSLSGPAGGAGRGRRRPRAAGYAVAIMAGGGGGAVVVVWPSLSATHGL